MKKSRSTTSRSITDQAIEFPELEDEVSLNSLRKPTGLLSRVWGWMQARQMAHSSTKRLRVAETVSLGEKRFVAVVQVDGRHFLLAGGPTNIALLAQLDEKEKFEDVLKKTMIVPGKRAGKHKRPANTALKTPFHPLPEVAEKKIQTTRGQQLSKPTGKRTASPGVSAKVSQAGHLNGTQAYSAVLKETMSASGKRPTRANSKQNGKWAVEQNGHYT